MSEPKVKNEGLEFFLLEPINPPRKCGWGLRRRDGAISRQSGVNTQDIVCYLPNPPSPHQLKNLQLTPHQNGFKRPKLHSPPAKLSHLQRRQLLLFCLSRIAAASFSSVFITKTKQALNWTLFLPKSVQVAKHHCDNVMFQCDFKNSKLEFVFWLIFTAHSKVATQ